MTSRVRCSCGRIYDPVKHATCPDCGAESSVESVVVAETVKPPAPPEPLQRGAPGPLPKPLGEILRAVPMALYAVAAVVAVLILFLVMRRPSGSPSQASTEPHQQAVPSGQTTPAELPSQTVAPSIAPA